MYARIFVSITYTYLISLNSSFSIFAQCLIAWFTAIPSSRSNSGVFKYTIYSRMFYVDLFNYLHWVCLFRIFFFITIYALFTLLTSWHFVELNDFAFVRFVFDGPHFRLVWKSCINVGSLLQETNAFVIWRVPLRNHDIFTLLEHLMTLALCCRSSYY